MYNSDNSYQYIIDEFGEDKIRERYEMLYNYMHSYIVKSGYEEKVTICANLLDQAILDYFVDVKRLKDLHHIKKINDVKIHAYTVYWLWRRRPLQVNAVADTEQDYDLVFINEKFVSAYILSFLTGDTKIKVTDQDEKLVFAEFSNNLLYSLKYRLITAQKIESVIEGFQAGCVFGKRQGELK